MRHGDWASVNGYPRGAVANHKRLISNFLTLNGNLGTCLEPHIQMLSDKRAFSGKHQHFGHEESIFQRKYHLIIKFNIQMKLCRLGMNLAETVFSGFF